MGGVLPVTSNWSYSFDLIHGSEKHKYGFSFRKCGKK